MSALDHKVSLHADGCDSDRGAWCSCLAEKAQKELSALRAENARMREALEKCRDVLAGHAMTKQELIDALRSARAALGGRDA